MKIVKTRKTDDEVKAMAAFVAVFTSIEDALAFEKAALSSPNIHLPPCARRARRRPAHRAVLALAQYPRGSLELK